MLTTLTIWLDELVAWINRLGPDGYMWKMDYVVRGFFALVIVSLVCGAVGSLVVSNRMAFFSDALAHCAFAGVALGLLVAILFDMEQEEFQHWLTVIMVGWGILIGVLITYVHEKTLLPSDTVIGVFFAGALGLGAIFTRQLRERRLITLESFIFGDPLNVGTSDLVWLFLLLILTAVFLCFFYNPLLFGSFNASLAKSRRVPARQARYLFITLLGMIVGLCFQTVGVLLINGLLIVPGATASCLSRNMRQVLWWSLGLALFCAVAGLWLSWEIDIHFRLKVGVSGVVLILAVLQFGLAMAIKPLLRNS